MRAARTMCVESTRRIYRSRDCRRESADRPSRQRRREKPRAFVCFRADRDSSVDSRENSCSSLSDRSSGARPRAMFAAGIAATRCVHTRGIYSRPVSARSNEARLAIASARPRRALRSAPSPSIVSVKASATHAGDAREPPRSRVADIVRGDDAPPSRPVTSAVTHGM